MNKQNLNSTKEISNEDEQKSSSQNSKVLETKISANIRVIIASASVIAGVATGLGLGFSSLGLSFFGSTTAVQIGALTLGASALTSGIIGFAVALGVGLIGAGIYYAVKAIQKNTYKAEQNSNDSVLAPRVIPDSNKVVDEIPSKQSIDLKQESKLDDHGANDSNDDKNTTGSSSPSVK